MSPTLGSFAARWLVLVPVWVAIAFFALPLAGLLARVPWGDLLHRIASRQAFSALEMSIVCPLLATAVSLVLGLPLAVWLAGKSSPLRTVTRILVTLPLVLPPVVAGIALLFAYGRNGLVGAPAARLFGWAAPFTTAGVVIADTYVAMPFFVLTAEAGLRSFDRRFAGAAATLGAGPWTRFLRVTLPMVGPTLGVGLVICWARALGEFCATIMFAGNLEGRTQTLPLAVFCALETDPDAAVALSLILIAISVGVLFALRGRLVPRR